MEGLAKTDCLNSTKLSAHKTTLRMTKRVHFLFLFLDWTCNELPMKIISVMKVSMFSLCFDPEEDNLCCRQMCLFVGLWLHLCASVTMLPVLHGWAI